MSDNPGDPGSQLPYQEFSTPLLSGSYLIGISHFPDPGGIGIRVGFPFASPSLSFVVPLYSSFEEG